MEPLPVLPLGYAGDVASPLRPIVRLIGVFSILFGVVAISESLLEGLSMVTSNRSGARLATIVYYIRPFGLLIGAMLMLSKVIGGALLLCSGLGFIKLRNLAGLATAGTIVIGATDFCINLGYVLTYLTFVRSYQPSISAIQFVAIMSLSTIARLCVPAMIFFVIKCCRDGEAWPR